MYNFICVFFPSVISILMDKHLLKSKYTIETLVHYLMYCLFNNTLLLLVFIRVFKTKYDVWNCINLYPGMAVKYCVLAIVFSIFLSFIHVIIKKNMGVEIEVKKS